MIKKYTKVEAQRLYFNVYFIGEIFFIGDGAKIIFIQSKYLCGIDIHKNHCKVHIGCERREKQNYIINQDALANEHDRKWWDEEGKTIFDLLCSFIDKYEEKYCKK